MKEINYFLDKLKLVCPGEKYTFPTKLDTENQNKPIKKGQGRANTGTADDKKL